LRLAEDGLHKADRHLGVPLCLIGRTVDGHEHLFERSLWLCADSLRKAAYVLTG